MASQHTLFITGAAGYVGAMLCDQFSKRDDVATIVALDKEECPELLHGNEKVVWVTANTSDNSWQEKVAGYKPDIVINTAWQIREMYGEKETQWKWNVGGSKQVFAFAFETSSVKKLIHFSTVSLYGAFPSNTFERMFTEDEPAREDQYLYGLEKAAAERVLRKTIDESPRKDEVQVFVVRPAAITGPRGRFMRVRFGLQAALSGQLRQSFIHRIISLLVSFVPATKGWVRQFIHEDDVVDIVKLFAFQELDGVYEVFNISPPGEPVFAPDMARAVGKKILPVYPWMVRLAFFFFWHVTRGRVPTSRGGWKFYSYPIVVDGRRLSKRYGFSYAHNSRDAFYHTAGRYESHVPEALRR